MSMSLSLSHRMEPRLELTQQAIVVAMPPIQWSLVCAFNTGSIDPPPYVPPTYEEAEFSPRLKLELRRVDDFELLTHASRMCAVDTLNRVFRFAYARGRNAHDEEKGYYKIPLLRNRHVDADEIKVKITAAEYEYATAVCAAVGDLERIARAVPYYALYTTVLQHLKRMGTTLSQTVLVAVDRGGRIPCLILQRALGVDVHYSIKVDQNGRGDGLDLERLTHFVDRAIVRGKHVLFVDSTVDSGRQIHVLRRYFDHPGWRDKLGHLGWSIVGSNEDGSSVAANHTDLNWGVDPDVTFEDNPELMGVDYAPNQRTKTVECECVMSRAIRMRLLAVPDGYYYAAADVEEQLATQRAKWEARQLERQDELTKLRERECEEYQRRKAELPSLRTSLDPRDQLEARLVKMLSSRRWQKSAGAYAELPDEELDLPPIRLPALTKRVLIIGDGKRETLSDLSADYVALSLVPSALLVAGTSGGNPGKVLARATRLFGSPAVAQTYAPEGSESHFASEANRRFVGVDKDQMRRLMINESDVVLVLGGLVGTLREALLAFEYKKSLIVIDGYGPVAQCLTENKVMRRRPHLIVCSDLAEAVDEVLFHLRLQSRSA